MKNKYKELLERTELKEDFSDSIRQSVYQHETKPKKQYRTLKVAAALGMAALLVMVPNMIGKTANKSSFKIMADEAIYDISKGDIVLNELNLEEYGELALKFNSTTNEVIFFNALPLSVYVEGDKIESITYTLNSGDFYKFVEGNAPEDAMGSEVGVFSTSKSAYSLASLIAQGFHIDGDASKADWLFNEVGKKEITIPYESQKTIDGLYGINVVVNNEELVKLANVQIPLIEDEAEQFINGYLQKKENALFEGINSLQLDVRINYTDGTSETAKLNFKADAENYKVNFSN